MFQNDVIAKDNLATEVSKWVDHKNYSRIKYFKMSWSQKLIPQKTCQNEVIAKINPVGNVSKWGDHKN